MAVVVILEHISQRLARRHLTFTVGREMFNAYNNKGGRVHEIRVSLVSQKDIEETLRTQNLGLHRPIRLLSVGRLDPEKGIHVLIEAVEELIKEKRLDVFLQIVGKSLRSEEERRLRWEVNKRGLARYVRFLGYAPHGPNLFELYRQSDIFVLPSLSGEGFPQTLFEATASGIPVIATKVAGIPYLIEDGENGLLINPGFSGEISEAIMRIISNAELRRSLVRKGLAMAMRHTLEVERDKMIANIEEFLKQGGAKNASRRLAY